MFRKLKEIQGHSGAIYTCTFDGNFLYTGSADKFVTRWNLEEGTQDKFAIRFEQSVYSLEIFQSLLFVGLSDGALHIFDLESRKELKYFTQHTKALFSLKANGEKGHLYAGDADGNLSVWDLESLELIIYLPLDAGKIRDISVEKGGDHFALSCQDGTLRIFESSHFNEISTINAHKEGTTSSIFHPNISGQLISGGKDAMIRVWNRGGELHKEIPAHNFAIYRLAFTNGEFLSISRDKNVKVWSDNMDFLQRLDFKEGGHKHSVNDCVVLDQTTFATVGDDKRIIVWSPV